MDSVEKRREAFIRKAREVHHGEPLDYSRVIYVNNRTPVEIVDHGLRDDGSEYGSFWQTPSNHLKGHGHPDRRNARIASTLKRDWQSVLEDFRKAHPGEETTLDYSKAVYKGMHEKICIIDHAIGPDGEEYGEYWQEPAAHRRGCGHPRKAADRHSEETTRTTEQFVDYIKKVHEGRPYDYSEVVYRGYREKVTVICRKKGVDGREYGMFVISADNLSQGKGCPKCGNQLSVAEDQIASYLEEVLGTGSVRRRVRDVVDGMELDIYVPRYRFAVEYNGLRWHSEQFGKGRNYHLSKLEACEKKGITLFSVFEDEYLCHKDLVLDKILDVVGVNSAVMKIGARKTVVETIGGDEADAFLDSYHIQGHARSTEYYGAFFDGRLLGVMSFTRRSEGRWEMKRFATDIKVRVNGLGSKLFTAFVRDHNPREVVTFMDRRWSGNRRDNLYVKIGFVEDGIIPPSYTYTDGHGKRHHKFGFRKKRMMKKYGYPSTMTEKEMAQKSGFFRVWDCGLVRYVWKAHEC